MSSAPGGSTAETRSAVGFLIELARALHSFGSPAHRLEAALALMAEKLGLAGQFFSTPTAIFAYLGQGDQQQTVLVRVEPGSVDLARLSTLEEVIGEVAEKRLSAAQAAERVRQALAEPDRWGPGITTLAFGLASAAAACFFGGGWAEIASAGGVGLVLGALALVAGRLPALARVFEPGAAFLASLLAAASAAVPAGWLLGPAAGPIVLLAGLIVLVPGLTLTVAMTELATQHLVSGSARMAGALVKLLTLGFGSALGAWVARPWLPAAVVQPAGLPPWVEPIALALAALGFTILFRARPADYGWILLAAAAALEGGRLGSRLLGPQLGAFLGALLVGAGSNLFARLAHRPAAVTQLPGMMLLVPGSLGFKSIAQLVAANVEAGVEAAFAMGLVAAALVTGLLIANVLVPPKRLL
ncbi:MAG: threonine/serine exporter family protein [Thermoanaerobaculia bacterium]